jgi:hypothetical protein
MLKKLSTFLIMLALFTSASLAQWTFEGAWPDTSRKGGTHGIAVSPDGKVFQASFFSTQWISPNGDTILTYPLLVFNADGSFVDSLHMVTSPTGVDTFKSGCRGLGVDQNGNILYVHSGPNKIVRINYQTLAGMGSGLLAEVGSSPTAPSVADDGTIFIGPVVGGGTTAIAMYDTDLNYVGNAVVGPPAISRTMEVSADGNTIYWMPFTASPLQVFVYERPDEFSDFELIDSILQGMSIETSAWNPATGLLWVSHDNRGTGPYTHVTWYGYDVNTNTIVDSFSLAPDSAPSDEFPRGLDFSPDGSAAYVGLFGTKYDRIYKFSKSTSIQKDDDIIVSDYSLSQNYPNPFNPTTDIKFTVSESGFISLKIYDMLGREIAVLVNENLTAGAYTYNFNAADLASGTYIYQLNANGVRMTKKMTLLK